MTDEYYGEVPEHHVSPELVKAAKETFEFCKRRYGGERGGREIKLKWLNKGQTAFVFAKLLSDIKRLHGEETDLVEQGYMQSDEEISGCVKTRWTDPEKPGPIFINAQTQLEKITFTIGHEFYHARFSPGCLTPSQIEADEKEANEFGRRVEREMREMKREEEMERWRERYRELQSKDKG